MHQGFDRGEDDRPFIPHEREEAIDPLPDALRMGRDLIIGKCLPLRKETGDPTAFPLKKAEVFEEEFGVTEVRRNDQNRTSHLLSPPG